MQETYTDYEQRKKDHILLALKKEHQSQHTGLSYIKLIHEALPDLNWSDVDISSSYFHQKTKTPFFVAAMTGGFPEAQKINFQIAKACDQRGWMMGVGSQRKQINLPEAKKEWIHLKKSFPNLCLFGNLGLSQLIHISVEQVEEMVAVLGAKAMVIHTNALQECMQPEGTPYFKNGEYYLSLLAEKLSIPVCLKETGCGFSYLTLKRIQDINLYAVDVSGYGGTHWGRIEGSRSQLNSLHQQVSQTFAEWGNDTLSCLLSAQKVKNKRWKVWASGGLKTGLDAAKCFALGASAAGWASLILEKAMEGDQALDHQMSVIEHELKIALFCTGSKNIQDLQKNSPWQWVTHHES